MQRKWLPVVLVITTLVLLVGVVPAAAAAKEYGIVHIVQRGETLYSIARRYGVDMWTIARANGIVNPNRIYVGQRLVIPTGRPAGTVHVVRQGETLTRIALRYGVSVWAIARANNIINLNRIYVGQRLTIPAPASPPVPPPAPPPAPPPQPNPSSSPWFGEYFNNTTLTAPPRVTRYDASIDFNWGWGAAVAGVPADYFSVRWSGTFNFAGGTYRFYAKVDDGVRVYVDGVLIINGWRDGAVRLYTADRALAAGAHTVQVDYYERIQVARIHFWWEPLPGPTPTPTPMPPPGVGWFGQFYNNMDLQDPPFATRYDPWIGFEWGTGSPLPGMRSDFFSIRWTTTAYLKAGTYRFCAMIDDGARIWVDGYRVLDEWHPTNAVAYCGKRWVAAGNHEIKVEYYEEGGNALIYVWWEDAD